MSQIEYLCYNNDRIWKNRSRRDSMKNIKNITLPLIIALCSFFFGGIVNVKAVANANNFDIVCNPDSIEKGGTSSCYVVAQINGTEGIHGVIAKAITMKHLTVNKSNPVGSASSNVVAEYKTNGQVSENVPGLNCSTTNGSFCAFFTTKSGMSNQILPNSGVAVPGIQNEGEYTGYTAVGFIGVTLDDTATNADCGEICISTQYAATQSGYGELSAGTTKACDEITPLVTNTGSGTTNVETGSFASYAVLIAGAIIAISIITIAKKHNKIYKV